MQISDAEWQVMKIIWMQGEQTSTDLIRVLVRLVQVDHSNSFGSSG